MAPRMIDNSDKEIAKEIEDYSSEDESLDPDHNGLRVTTAAESVASTQPAPTHQEVEQVKQKWYQQLGHHIADRVTTHSTDRKLLRGAAWTSATSAGLSASINSVDDAAATSAAIARAVRNLDQILREGTVDDEDEVKDWLTKINKDPRSRLPPGECQAYTPSAHHRSLIKAAAIASKKIYDPQDGLLYAPGGDDKPCAIWHEKIHGQRILIVAIRGTASIEDWLLDINGQRHTSKELRQGSWHKGILRVAENLAERVAARIEQLKARLPDTKGVLFTGHSLGGGVAQVLLASSMTEGTALSRVLPGLQIHCITFAAPPVATVPITPPPAPGVFLAIINEGDPVPLLQEAYANILLALYVLTTTQFEEKFGVATVPAPVFRVSGRCVVLKDESPDDPDVSRSVAVQVDAGVLERVIFGNPWLHPMDEYLAQLTCFEDEH